MKTYRYLKLLNGALPTGRALPIGHVLKEIKHRPLLCGGIAFICGLAEPWTCGIAGPALVLASLVRRWFLAAIAAMVCFGAGLGLRAKSAPLPSGTSEVEATVIGLFETSGRSSVGKIQIGRESVRARVSGPVNWVPGDQVVIRGTLIRRTFQVSEIISARESGLTLWRWAKSVRAYGIHRFKKLVGERDGAWLSALTLNAPGDLTKADRDSLRASGLYHLVSASGSHVWVLATVFHLILIACRLPRIGQIAVIAAVLLVYAVVTDWHAPTIRAILMWLLMAVPYRFRRSPDALSAIALSAIGWLVFHPADVFDPGFQLSYLVSSALVLAFMRIRDHVGTAMSTVGSSVIASLASEPIAAWWFGRIVPIAPLANTVGAVPAMTAMIAGFLMLIPGAGELLAYPVSPVLWGLQWVCETAAAAPVIKLDPRAVPGWIYALYFGAMLFLYLGLTPEQDQPDPSPPVSPSL